MARLTLVRDLVLLHIPSPLVLCFHTPLLAASISSRRVVAGEADHLTLVHGPVWRREHGPERSRPRHPQGRRWMNVNVGVGPTDTGQVQKVQSITEVAAAGSFLRLSTR